MADAVTYRATGKRKTSVARVILIPGPGKTTINGRDIDQYFGRKVLETIALMPFETTRTTGKFDVRVNVYGGGISAQAGAVRHGIARALCEADETLRTPLKRAGFLSATTVRSSARRPASTRRARSRSSASADAAQRSPFSTGRREAARRRSQPCRTRSSTQRIPRRAATDARPL